MQSAYNISIKEQAKVKLFNRLKSFLFQPLDLDSSDTNFATAFCGGMP